VIVPIFLVFAEKDEYLDRPLSELVEWFKIKLEGKDITIKIIKGANHGFAKREKAVVGSIRNWMEK
jgi:dienelactone hydrolase